MLDLEFRKPRMQIDFFAVSNPGFDAKRSLLSCCCTSR